MTINTRRRIMTVEYEAVVMVDENFEASASGSVLEDVLREGRHYMGMYGEEGCRVEMMVYEKLLLVHEVEDTRAKE